MSLMIQFTLIIYSYMHLNLLGSIWSVTKQEKSFEIIRVNYYFPT